MFAPSLSSPAQHVESKPPSDLTTNIVGLVDGAMICTLAFSAFNNNMLLPLELSRESKLSTSCPNAIVRIARTDLTVTPSLRNQNRRVLEMNAGVQIVKLRIRKEKE